MTDLEYVHDKLQWMRAEGIWPNGLRYLWTDAFGVVLFVSLYHETGESVYLDRAEAVVEAVDEVLGRERGYRIGEAPDRDGQYYHYLAMWIFALTRLGAVRPSYREKALEVVREIHDPFVNPERGVYWKMKEDLSGPYPGVGLGALDPFHGYVVYRLLDEEALSDEIADMRVLVRRNADRLNLDQDLGLGMMLWMTHFFPEEDWAQTQRPRCLDMLDTLWVDPPGYFCRRPSLPNTKFAFTNYGISVGLQAVREQLGRVETLHAFFEDYKSGDEYDRAAITHVMACSAHFPGRLLRRPSEERQDGE